MAYSYKTYSDIKDVMKKFVNASEGSVIYSLGKTRFMTLAKEAGAIYKVGASALVRLYMNPLYKLFRLSGKLDRLKNHILPSRGMFFL